MDTLSRMLVVHGAQDFVDEAVVSFSAEESGRFPAVLLAVEKDADAWKPDGLDGMKHSIAKLAKATVNV